MGSKVKVFIDKSILPDEFIFESNNYDKKEGLDTELGWDEVERQILNRIIYNARVIE